MKHLKSLGHILYIESTQIIFCAIACLCLFLCSPLIIIWNTVDTFIECLRKDWTSEQVYEKNRSDAEQLHDIELED